MRPGQNKRMRGRSNRKGPNPLTRTYESNGPDVKIRGTAHHVAEKYLQLARDAHSSGDPVMAESYLQHAEHYFRLIAAAQLAQQQAQAGFIRGPEQHDQQEEDDDDDDFGVVDRFASPQDRNQPQPVQTEGRGSIGHQCMTGRAAIEADITGIIGETIKNNPGSKDVRQTQKLPRRACLHLSLARQRPGGINLQPRTCSQPILRIRIKSLSAITFETGADAGDLIVNQMNGRQTHPPMISPLANKLRALPMFGGAFFFACRWIFYWSPATPT